MHCRCVRAFLEYKEEGVLRRCFASIRTTVVHLARACPSSLGLGVHSSRRGKRAADLPRAGDSWEIPCSGAKKTRAIFLWPLDRLQRLDYWTGS